MSQRLVTKKEVRERFKKLFTNNEDAECAIRQAEDAAGRYWTHVKDWERSIFAGVPASPATQGLAGNIFFSITDFDKTGEEE